MARIDEVLRGEKPWWKFWLDVAGHAGLGCAYALPFMAAAIFWLSWGRLPAVALGLAVATVGGIAREAVQAVKSGKLHLFDRVLDVLGHPLGVLPAWAILELARHLAG